MVTKLKTIDLLMLGLMILSLPGIEAPKNIFLVGYLITRVLIEIFQFNQGIRKWNKWDYIFLIIVGTAYLSTLFAGMPHLEEWKGYSVLLTAILTGWALSRAQYTKENYKGLFVLIISGAFLTLLCGLYQYLILQTKSTLQLHSVGHVNHSAIYLTMIFGASFSWFLSEFNLTKNKFKLIQENNYLFILGVLSLLFHLSLIIGQSRAAYGVGIMIGLIITFFVAKDRRIKTIGITSIILILLLSVTFKSSIIEKQIANQKASNVLASRDKVWNVSLEAARFSPILGIGLSNWHFITLEDLKKSTENRGKQFNSEDYAFPGHSHSLYLSALVERGILGLLITLMFCTFWIGHIISSFNWAKKSNQSICLWGASLSAWIATFGIGFVNTTFHHEHAILACLFLGLYLSYTNEFLKKNNRK
jgi:O-antigen ligase